MHWLQKFNKYTQKNFLFLFFINIILEEIVKDELYTFMDKYLGYNQISIAHEDHHKAIFITP